MAIEVMDYALAGGLGVLDQFLEHKDDTASRVGWGRWSNMVRLGVMAGGIAITQMMPRYARYAHPLAIGATTLVAKSVAKEFGGEDFAGPSHVAGGRKVVHVPQGQAAPSAPQHNSPAGYGRSYMPEFDLVRTL